MALIPRFTATWRETATRRLFLRQGAELWLHELDPTWSLTEIRARVVEVVRETADVKTFVLRPNRRWRGHRAGQYTTIEVEIDGVRVRRCYSISSAPADSRLAITVKRVPGGRVSSWLHDHLGAGDVVGLGAAAGDFVLPDHEPAQLLLISGGSGITPVMSILRDLAARDAIRDVTFVHYARSRADVIFRAELDALGRRHPGLRLLVHASDEGGRFDEADLARRVPDFAERTTYLCGPPGLMTRVEQLWDQAGAALRRERFVLPTLEGSTDSRLVQLRLARSDRAIAVNTTGTLLEQLERAGERPASGCRIGICHTCKRRKHRGTVRNLVNGALSTEPDEDIQLCISVPCADVEIDL
jgi:ferredoxin-NADP reductase